MDQYNITGMSCAACQAKVEKAVQNVPGVSSCAVNLLTNSLGVTGTANENEIIEAVNKAGYGATKKRGMDNKTYDKSDNSDKEIQKITNRLIWSIILLIPLMYVSMGHSMWNFWIPEFLDNPVSTGIYEMLLSGLVMVINEQFFIRGFRGLINRSTNMDTLVSLGATASYAYSVVVLFKNVNAGIEKVYGDYYFESAAMILTLITVGKLLEAKAKGKTTNALKALMSLSPETATLRKDGEEIVVPISEVKPGDIFVVRPGDKIPVDGICIEGFSAVNEAAFTGESIPVDKKEGDTVSQATINIDGFMVCEAKRVGEDTSLAKVIRMVSDAAATKAPIAKIADRVSGVFVPAVIVIALITFLSWLILGESVGFSLSRAISVLVISCPCALGLATPVAIMVGNGVGAKQGILFKTAETLEQTGKIQIVALDKTGTITTGVMHVTDVICYDVEENELLAYAASLEAKSEHPISKAIIKYTEEKNIEIPDAEGFKAIPGNGLSGLVNNENVYAGSISYILEMVNPENEKINSLTDSLSKAGKTPVLIAKEGKLLGIIALQDTIRKDSKEAVLELENMGIRVVMLTGDNDVTARAIAKEAGIKDVVSSVKPDGKERVISLLKEQGTVAMVGDGINDAPALTRADVGIAIGAGTDIAIDAADIVVTKDSLKDVPASIRLSKSTLINIKENLFWAFFYNVLGIPLAAGLYIKPFGLTLNPMFGAAAMSLSSFFVVSNALRLNFVKVYNTKKDKIQKNHIEILELPIENPEDNNMKIKVTGMMCVRCETHVKKELEKIEGVTEALADHEAGIVTLKVTKEISEEDLKNAVSEAGYEFEGIL